MQKPQTERFGHVQDLSNITSYNNIISKFKVCDITHAVRQIQCIHTIRIVKQFTTHDMIGIVSTIAQVI